nr:response regulator [Xanthomonadales bacterium]
MRVLLAEDDTLLGEGIQTALRRALMTVDWVQDGVAALAALRQEPFDAAVMDLGLPRLDGTAVIRDARR